jgi:hypothetical protein
MSTKYISTEVEVGLEEWRDDELIEEIQARGYSVEDDDDVEIQWRWRRGDKKEALVLMERKYKWLRGLSDLIS